MLLTIATLVTPVESQAWARGLGETAFSGSSLGNGIQPNPDIKWAQEHRHKCSPDTNGTR